MIGWLMRLLRRETMDRPVDDAADKADARDRADRAIEATIQLQAEINAMTRSVRQEQHR